MRGKILYNRKVFRKGKKQRDKWEGFELLYGSRTVTYWKILHGTPPTGC